MEFLKLIFHDYTLSIVALGSAIIGFVSGSLGAFAVLRRQSLLGDAISHATLPGIVLAFMLTGFKDPLVLMTGAAVAGVLGTFFILTIVSNTRIKTDGAQGIVLSVFFGIGLLFLTFVQKQQTSSQAGLDKFLFGQAAALLSQDIIVMSCFGGAVLVLLLLFWKEIKLMTFDSGFGGSLGFSKKNISLLINFLLVISIVIGLQTVGVILMSAMIVAPAAAARQWTDNLGKMVALSGFFGAISGITGSVLSSKIADLPTGPTIVLCLTAIALVSILLAPGRGLVFQRYRAIQNRYNFQSQRILLDMYKGRIAGDEEELLAGIKIYEKEDNRTVSIKRALKLLMDREFIEEAPDKTMRITQSGEIEAKELERGNLA